MGKKQPSRLRAFLGHKITQDVLSKLIVAGVLTAAKALRDSENVRRKARRAARNIRHPGLEPGSRFLPD